MNTKKTRTILIGILVALLIVVVLALCLIIRRNAKVNREFSAEEIAAYTKSVEAAENSSGEWEIVTDELNNHSLYTWSYVLNEGGKDYYYYWGNPEKVANYPQIFDDGRIIFVDETGTIYQLVNAGSSNETVEEITWLHYQGSNNRLYMVSTANWVVENPRAGRVSFYRYNKLIESVELVDGMTYLGNMDDMFIFQDKDTIYQINTETWKFDKLVEGQVLALNYRMDQTHVKTILYLDAEGETKVLLSTGITTDVVYPGGYQYGLAPVAEETE